MLITSLALAFILSCQSLAVEGPKIDLPSSGGELIDPKRGGGTIGKGGESYLDELEGYKQLVLSIWTFRRPFFQRVAGISKKEHQEALELMRATHLYHDGKMDVFIGFNGEEIPYENIFTDRPKTEFFNVNGEQKDAVNYSDEYVALAVFKRSQLDELVGHEGRLLRLVAHELLGAAGLEKSKQDHISRHFGLHEQAMRKYNAIRMMPLASSVIKEKIAIRFADEQSCHTAQARWRYEQIVFQECGRFFEETTPNFIGRPRCQFEGRVSGGKVPFGHQVFIDSFDAFENLRANFVAPWTKEITECELEGIVSVFLLPKLKSVYVGPN